MGWAKRGAGRAAAENRPRWLLSAVRPWVAVSSPWWPGTGVGRAGGEACWFKAPGRAGGEVGWWRSPQSSEAALPRPAQPSRSLSLQIDLRYEAQNLEQFQRNFRNVTSVKFPTPLRPFVTRDVLVETYEVRAWQLGLAGPCAHSQAIVARTVPVGEGA